MLGDNVRPIEVFPIERRQQPRESSMGVATVMFSDGSGRVGLGSVELLDQTDTGLGVRSRSQIEPGMTVTLYPTVCGVGPCSVDAVATYCQEDQNHAGMYHIGLRVDRKLAA